MNIGQWTITYTLEPNDADLEYIAEQIKKGFTSGEIVQEKED